MRHRSSANNAARRTVCHESDSAAEEDDEILPAHPDNDEGGVPSELPIFDAEPGGACKSYKDRTLMIPKPNLSQWLVKKKYPRSSWVTRRRGLCNTRRMKGTNSARHQVHDRRVRAPEVMCPDVGYAHTLFVDAIQ